MGVAYGYGYGAQARRHARRPYEIEDADALAYVAAMSVEPPTFIKRAIEELVLGLKADGLWSGNHLIALHAIHDNQAARVNLMNPAHVGLLAGASGNGPDFLALNGFQGNGTDSTIDWDRTMTELGANLNSHCILAWCLEFGGGGRHVGSEGSDHIEIRNFGSGALSVRPATTVSIGPYTIDGAEGLMGYSRSASNAVIALHNGVQVGSSSQASLSMGTTDMHTGRRNTSFDASRIAATAVMPHRAPADQLKFFNRLLAYMEAVHGTPVPF
jgi:hypothetical protein